MINMNVELQLASKSPRRRELLQQIGVAFSVIDVNVEELRNEGEAPQCYVQRLSCSKAEAGFLISAGRPSLGADTIVVCDGLVLEKPQDFDDFLTMINRLSGRQHDVYTAVCLYNESGASHFVHKTQVYFREIEEEEAVRYWHSGEPNDKAGGYGIQGRAAVFVERIEGSYSGVMGLPLYETAELLKANHIPIWRF